MNVRIPILLILAVLVITPMATAADGVPTQAFRDEHAEVKEHLDHLHQMVGSMASADAAAQQKTAKFVAKFLREHILEHAKWEEERLYPAVDKRTHAGTHPFTGTMRYEHKIVGRWIEELGTMASGEKLDGVAFARKADRLLGLIAAHFEEEEEVLLPILDKSTTREELEKELGLDAKKPH